MVNNIFKTNKTIIYNLPFHIYSVFFDSQLDKINKFHLDQERRMMKKFSWIKQKHYKKISLPKKLTYFAINRDKPLLNNSSNSYYTHPSHTFFFSPSFQATHTVNIQMELKSPTKTLLEHRKNWFINLTSTPIPDKVVGLLQHGENFSLPTKNNSKLIFEMIKNFEYNIKITIHLDNNKKIDSRNRFVPMFKQLRVSNFTNLLHDIEINNALKYTNSFVKHHPSIIYTRADKGNTVVAMDKVKYTHDMENFLLDINTYAPIKKNPVNSILISLKALLKKWRSHDYISDISHRNLNSSLPILPRAYGVPKIR
ncbi:uncharacterized protein LOC109861317 [Pseudomyrmex gracilis]|uniref:uncharacterized protein LOC109861317 n=1 Tax=Pseudomyrmex gracilis TaxID=219809 RepID=UPI000995B69A|nr:uncharacterized protein LOC109861317 [Pseudomyrmex gracilis]XP_020296491.1 uncharacterized protein LOC109861317 [Pseudomyrmex gracilis]XP_020296492.1 uncharacterized protein LOC109861317 [Pseudomyrmex gracilis]XP_020296493.1 uncharacterized protein LOC109861317 [Pseudomyrmex gracilis]XP_020296494.1 uncharacterized protein LOC109861317 [Pseudomyrmex gracilis]